MFYQNGNNMYRPVGYQSMNTQSPINVDMSGLTEQYLGMQESQQEMDNLMQVMRQVLPGKPKGSLEAPDMKDIFGENKSPSIFDDPLADMDRNSQTLQGILARSQKYGQKNLQNHQNQQSLASTFQSASTNPNPFTSTRHVANAMSQGQAFVPQLTTAPGTPGVNVANSLIGMWNSLFGDGQKQNYGQGQRQGQGGQQSFGVRMADQNPTPQKKSTRTSSLDGSRITPELIDSLMMAESAGKADAVSPKGAQGTFQVMPKTFEEEARKLGLKNPDPFNPEHSRMVGVSYLKQLERRYNGNIPQALAAYNWGMGNLGRVLNDPQKSKDWYNHLPEETSNYIPKILGDNWQQRYN